MNQNQRREYLRARDLEMSKQMERTIKDAQLKPKPDLTLKLLKPIQINRDLITGTPQYKAEKQLSDLLLAQQIENTVKQAMYAVEGKTSEPSKSSITQEMIDDYKKEVMKPVDIGGKKFLYNPVDMPELPKPFEPKPLSNREISEEDYQTYRTNILTAIETRQAELESLEQEKQELEDRYKSGGTFVFDEETRRKELTKFTNDDLKKIIREDLSSSLPSKINKENLVKRIITLEKAISLKTSLAPLDPILDEIEAKKVEIAVAQKDIKDATDAYRKAEGEYRVQLDEKEKNRLDELEYNIRKRQLVEEIQNDFNRLNQGKGTITRNPQETDDDFYNRLELLGAIPIDQKDIDKQVQTEIFMKAKKNVLELTTDLSKAETVVKMLNNDERFQMNKTFPRIKKQFSETFGLNNKDIDANEMTQFIQNELDFGAALTSPPEEGSAQDFNKKVRMFSKEQLIAFISELNSSDSSLNLLTGTDKFKKGEMVKELESKNLFNPNNIRMLLKLPPPEDTMFPAVPTGPTVPTGSIAEAKDEEEVDYADPLEETFGSGLKSHVLPSSVAFGKIAIDLNKLFYQNILSIKRPNGNKIIGHRNKRVSDNFVDIIFKMFENKPITQSDLRNIKDEQILYDNLIVQSGLHKSKKIPTNIEQTSEQMKNRLGLITGEIEAGNSNKALLSELHELLFKMVRVHLISKNAAAAYYKNIKDQFFTL
jgi:hypothetical protein